MSSPDNLSGGEITAELMKLERAIDNEAIMFILYADF